jgi:molybdopterin molybdotransferase
MTINDCFTPPDRLVPLDQALDMLADRLKPVVAIEEIPTFQAERRVLAEDLVAGVTSPPFACSAMDGFAFRFADLAVPSNAQGPGAAPGLTITARIAAGHAHQGTFGPGEAARIFTGAPLPPGLDTVAMQEDCTVEGDTLFPPKGLALGNFVRQPGDDFASGNTVLPRGRRLRPQDVAMAAAIGRDRIAVHARLRVGVFSTGDEVTEPGRPLAPGAIYGSNRHAVAALCAGMGLIVEDLGNIPDDLDETIARLEAASQRCDLLITTGGVSVGGEDHVRSAVEQLGAIHLWRLALKPGKPTALGHVRGVPFVGLPGYPVSAAVTFMLVARPVILLLSGATAEPLRPQRFPVRAAFQFDKDHPRRQFLRVSLRPGPDGTPEAVLYRSQEPSVLSSLVNTDGLVDVHESLRRIEPGDRVDFIPYGVLQW